MGNLLMRAYGIASVRYHPELARRQTNDDLGSKICSRSPRNENSHSSRAEHDTVSIRCREVWLIFPGGSSRNVNRLR